ncbi:hypothetical protein H5410_041354 [Solanum commersonii]|uniref:Uncharacterized protein n=1 Tax=Solanum commersonii TaxID=4109 RepID=A0A9J5XUI7_SOLCO|nr:hypothetical protein H5410_041354 [Solanum commersonii]
MKKKQNYRGRIVRNELQYWGDPTPIQCDASECSKEIEGKANECVQNNLLRLSKEFGVAFKGCSEEAFNLLLKIDQRRVNKTTTIEYIPVISDKKVAPKEVRNLIFDVNYKDKDSRSETRSRGRYETFHLS